jgi:hypothetical protein
MYPIPAPPLKSAVDRRSPEERRGFGDGPAENIAKQGYRALARRRRLDRGDKSKLHSLA